MIVKQLPGFFLMAAALLLGGMVSASDDLANDSREDSVAIVPPPVVLTDYNFYGDAVGHPPLDRVLYPIQSQPGYSYFYDAVNRPYAFTPKPIWVDQFPGIDDRASAEVRMYGVPGQSVRERLYHQRAYRALLKSEGVREVRASEK